MGVADDVGVAVGVAVDEAVAGMAVAVVVGDAGRVGVVVGVSVGIGVVVFEGFTGVIVAVGVPVLLLILTRKASSPPAFAAWAGVPAGGKSVEPVIPAT